MLTHPQIAACTGATLALAKVFGDHLNAAMAAYAIDTPKRQAAFLAQVGHESDGLLYTSEIWGPTPAQRRYELPHDKARELGNTKPGDGSRFRGHGLIQTTGRANHALARDRLRVRFGTRVPDFEAEPLRLCEPEWAAFSAADFWDMRRLNKLADTDQFELMTRRINGGLNGLADRRQRWEAGKKALGVL